MSIEKSTEVFEQKEREKNLLTKGINKALTMDIDERELNYSEKKP